MKNFDNRNETKLCMSKYMYHRFVYNLAKEGS